MSGKRISALLSMLIITMSTLGAFTITLGGLPAQAVSFEELKPMINSPSDLRSTNSYFIICEGEVPQRNEPLRMTATRDNDTIHEIEDQSIGVRYMLAIATYNSKKNVVSLNRCTGGNQFTIDIPENSTNFALVFYMNHDQKREANQHWKDRPDTPLTGSITITPNWEQKEGDPPLPPPNISITTKPKDPNAESGTKGRITAVLLASTDNVIDLNNFSRTHVGMVKVESTYEYSKSPNSTTTPSITVYTSDFRGVPLNKMPTFTNTGGTHSCTYNLELVPDRSIPPVTGIPDITIGAGKTEPIYARQYVVDAETKKKYATIRYDMYASPDGSSYSRLPAGDYASYISIEVSTPT